MVYTYSTGKTLLDLKVADETFLVTALLHRDNPDREDFTINEIVERAARENLTGELRPGVRVHATSHCVANRVPNPGRYRMLYAPTEKTRRLLRQGDDIHPERRGKIFPNPDDIPPRYHELIAWAQTRYHGESPKRERWLAAVLDLRGTGKHIWRDEDPDEYVRRLREDWE